MHEVAKLGRPGMRIGKAMVKVFEAKGKLNDWVRVRWVELQEHIAC